MKSHYIKVSIFALFFVGAVIYFWYTLNLLLVAASFNVQHLIHFVAAWLIFLTLSLLFFPIIDDYGIVYLAIFVASGCFFIFFKSSYIYLMSILVFILLLLLAYKLMHREARFYLIVALRRYWSRGLPFITTAIALIVALVCYFNPLIKFDQGGISIPPKTISLLMQPLAGIFKSVIPFYDPQMTIDEMLTISLLMKGQGVQPGNFSPDFLKNINLEEFKKGGIEGLMKNPEAVNVLKEELSKQAGAIPPKVLAEERNQLTKPLGITLKGDETIDKIIAELINAKVGKFISPYAKQISIGIAVILFFVIKLIAAIFGIVAALLAHLLFYILKLCRVIRIEKVMKEAEAIKI